MERIRTALSHQFLMQSVCDIGESGPSTRALNCLHNAGIDVVWKLLIPNKEDFRGNRDFKIRDMGLKTRCEVFELIEAGLHLTIGQFNALNMLLRSTRHSGRRLFTIVEGSYPLDDEEHSLVMQHKLRFGMTVDDFFDFTVVDDDALTHLLDPLPDDLAWFVEHGCVTYFDALKLCGITVDVPPHVLMKLDVQLAVHALNRTKLTAEQMLHLYQLQEVRRRPRRNTTADDIEGLEHP